MYWPIFILVFLFMPFAQTGDMNGTTETSKAEFPPAGVWISTDVIIDVGHGGIDSGTVFGDLEEKDINLEIARMTYEMLNRKGILVVLNRTDDRALSDDNRWLQSRSRHRRDLAQRKQLANDLRPRLMVSLHVNWSAKPDQQGPVVLYQNNEVSRQLAENVQRELNKLYGTSKLPVRGKTYYLLNHTDCPAVIVEMGYLSNPLDRQRLIKPGKQKEIAAAISAAIEQYLSRNTSG